MATIVVAAPPVRGELGPMLQLTEHLLHRGHRLTVMTGSRFRADVEARGARFVALTGIADWDDRNPVETFPQLATAEPGPELLNITFGDALGAAIPDEHAAIQAELEADPDALLLTNSLFMGPWAVALGAPGRRPRRWVAVACNPITLPSTDASPLGPLPAGPDGDAAAANLAAGAALNASLEPARARIEREVRALGATAPVPAVFDALYTIPDVLAVLSVPGVEFERSDAPNSIHLVGALPAPVPTGWTPPSWWGDLDEGRPVVVVTQGTFANHDLSMLVRPTLDALAVADVLVVAALGREVGALTGPVPANARVEEFVPFGHLLPRADVFVTNGGWGATQQALAAGVPVVVAGDSEDKVFVAARVGANGLGRDLGTARPSPKQVRDAVTGLLGDDGVRAAVRQASQVYARHDATAEVERLLGL